MWLIFNLKKEFKKISNSFNKFRKEITELTACSRNNQEKIKEFVSRKEISLMIENEILKVQSAQNPAPNSEPLTEQIKETHFNKVVMLKANKNRPELIKQAIRGLLEKGLRTTDIFNIVVMEKKIVGKTQFYHYLTLIKNELRTPVRTELRTKQDK